MRKSSKFPKSTQDEDQFPCTGSRGILHSLSNTTSGLSSFRQLQRFPENTTPGLEEHQVQHSNSRKAPGTPNHLEMRVPWVGLKGYAHFPQAPQEEASLSNRYVRATLNLLRQVEWTPKCRALKEGWISLQWLESRLVFHLIK